MVQLKHMSDSEYRGGLEAPDVWGCVVASLVGLPIFGYLTLIDALGDCASGTDCHKGFWSNVGLPTAGVVIALFLSVRCLAKTLRDSE